VAKEYTVELPVDQCILLQNHAWSDVSYVVEKSSTVFPRRNTNFDSCPRMRVLLGRSRSLAEKLQHIIEGKKSGVDT